MEVELSQHSSKTDLPNSGGDARQLREPFEKLVDKQEVLKSLLDLFLEATVQEKGDVEDGAPVMTQQLIEQIEAFLLQLSLCYQSYGCPTHTIEVTMSKVAKGLGVDAQFIVFPSHTVFELATVKTDKGLYRRHSQFFRTSFGYNFYKLQLVDELARRISSYAMDVDPSTAQTSSGLGEAAIDQAFERARAYSGALAGLAEPSPTHPTQDSFESGPPPIQRSVSTTDIASDHHSDPVLEQYKSVSAKESSAESRYRSLSGHGDIEEGKTDGVDVHHRPASAASKRWSFPLETPSAPFHFLLPRLRRRHSEKAHHTLAQSSAALGRMILDLARVGPNAYEVVDKTAGAQNRTLTYRNVFSKLAVEDGIALIRAIMKKKPLYSGTFKVFLLGISAFGCAGIFFGGSWTDMWVAFLLGVLVALIEYISLWSPTFSRIYEFTATFVASIIIRAISQYYTTLCYRAVLMSAIIFSLQGVTITLAFIDLMTKDLISGTTRLFYGLLISAMIGFAMDISTSTYAALAGRTYESVLEDSTCTADRMIDPNYYPPLLLITTLAFNILIESHPNQLIAMEIVCSACFVVYYYTAAHIDSQLPVILAAFTAGCLANLYSRFTGQPSVVYVIPAVFLLVPGSVAVSSFYTVLTLNLQGGLNLAFSVVTGALAIAIGVFTASTVVQVPDVEEYFHMMKAVYPGPNSSHLRRAKTHRNSALTL